MTPDQLNGTRLLSDLLVRMVKDSYSENSHVADQAREWLNMQPFEGMASVDRACGQLAAAQRAIATLSQAERVAYRKPSEWLDWSLQACDDREQLAELENTVELLITDCHRALFPAPEMSTPNNVRDHSFEDEYPSSNDHSPSF